MANIPKSAILMIGKHRERGIYERPDGKGGWMQTTPLPSDAEGKELYTQKGFKLLSSIESNNGNLACPLCDFVAETPGSLGSHLMRKHKVGDISKTQKGEKE